MPIFLLDIRLKACSALQHDGTRMSLPLEIDQSGITKMMQW